MSKLILIGSQGLLFIAAKAFAEQGVELMLCPRTGAHTFQRGTSCVMGSVVFFADIQSESLYAQAKAFAPEWILSIIFGQRIPAKFCQLASREALNFHPQGCRIVVRETLGFGLFGSAHRQRGSVFIGWSKNGTREMC